MEGYNTPALRHSNTRFVLHLETASEAAFLEEAVVVAHQQMGFHLAHGVQQNTDHDQHAGAAEKGRDSVRNRRVHGPREKERKYPPGGWKESGRRRGPCAWHIGRICRGLTRGGALGFSAR